MTHHLEELAYLQCDDRYDIRCGRCGEEIVDLAHVAMMTRPLPGKPFSPWCVDCAHQLIVWAGRGAENELLK